MNNHLLRRVVEGGGGSNFRKNLNKNFRKILKENFLKTKNKQLPENYARKTIFVDFLKDNLRPNSDLAAVVEC